MDSSRIRLEASWKDRLLNEFQKPYMVKLKQFIESEINSGKTIYPHGKEIFRALDLTPFDKVSAVIIGQDPYHGPGQAHGLCFSVKPHVPMPPSLSNIFQELHNDLGYPLPKNGDLTSWAQNGVLLLNAVLTVQKARAASHQNKGWEIFTDKIIDLLSTEREHLVFILWGSFAQKKDYLIDKKKHCLIKSPHPSPLSAHRGFFGSKPFSAANSYLQTKGLSPVNWRL